MLAALNVDAARLYRYKNDNNGWVLANSVPNERVKFGYQVVDENGRLIEEVAPQPSAAEAKIVIARLEAKAKRDAAVQRINQLYGSEKDIDYALRQALSSIDNSLANAEANVRALRAQRQRLETQAARIERAGNQLSADMIDNVATLNEQIDNFEIEMRQRRTQKSVERRRHAEDRKLFREVHGIAVEEDEDCLDEES